jgi:hypothetical protein
MTAPHPAFQGRTLDGKAQKVDVIRFITGGMWLDLFHVLQGPTVIYKPLPEASTQPFITPRNAIMHSQAGPRRTPWQSLWSYMFRTDVHLEAHTLANLDGTLIQTMPFNRRADCNYKANSWMFGTTRYGALSCETQDNGYPTLQTTPWSLQQMESLSNMLAIQCIAYKIACTAPTKWDDTGIGYHSQYREWSSFTGKTCPGAARIRQMDELRRITAGKIAAFYENCGGSCPGSGA